MESWRVGARFLSDSLSSINGWTWICIVVGYLLIRWYKKPHGKFPPGPRGWPFLGVVPFLSKAPVKDFKKWSVEKYGPIMSARIGTKDVVILNNHEAIFQAFVKSGNVFSDRPFIELFRDREKDGLVSRRFDKNFKDHKHFVLKYLRESGLGTKKMEEMVNLEAERFVQYLEEGNGKALDAKKTFGILTGNVVASMIFGKRFEYGNEEFIDFLNLLNLVFADPEHQAKFNMIHVWEFLAKIPPFKQTMALLGKRIVKILAKIQKDVDECKNAHNPNELNNFIDAFLHKKNNHQSAEESGYTDRQLLYMSSDLFIAGTETTSTTLCWLLLHCLHYPEYSREIVKEIDDTIGRDEEISMSHRQNMPVTCAFIQEVMRIKTVSPMAVHHRTMVTVQLGEYVIPKNTTVFANLYGTHMDPETWPNPQLFDPHRHIDENGKFVASNKIIPFSVGSRFCVGESLAKVEIFVFFVKILQKLDVANGKAKLPDIDNEIITSIIAPRECVLKFHFRG